MAANRAGMNLGERLIPSWPDLAKRSRLAILIVCGNWTGVFRLGNCKVETFSAFCSSA